jgi:hypothetical protein
MFRKVRFSRWLVGVVILAAVECAGLAAIELAGTSPAQAQFSDNSYRRHQYRSGGFFQQLFGPFNPRRYDRQYEESAPQSVDHSHAPNPRKRAKDVTPTTTVLVMGDGMADWLGYGLEDAFSDTPEVAIIRKEKQRSGLLRYDTKGDLDWWHVAREILTQEKANYVVMILGVSDRENIRERDLVKEAEKRQAEKEKNATAKGAQTKDEAAKGAQGKKPTDKPDQPAIKAPEPLTPKKSANSIIEFRSDQWAKIYSRRIDETIAALKSKGVPVFWVGLPSIRGTKSTADAVYLNDLYRARAERAGVNYIDVWDGFVDDSGKYSSYGPDYEGQTRRLRSADGVYFTKYGARKLAHYVERAIRRYMSNRALPVVLPSGPLAPVPGGGKSAVRPVVGPVVPLTVTTGNSDQLLGAAGSRQAYGDAIANDVLVKGEPVNTHPGRADDFVWQHGGGAYDASAPAAGGAAPISGAAAPAASPKTAVRQIDLRGGGENEAKDTSQSGSAAKSAQNSVAVPMPPQRPPRPVYHSAPRRHSIFPFNPLGWLR